MKRRRRRMRKTKTYPIPAFAAFVATAPPRLGGLD